MPERALVPEHAATIYNSLSSGTLTIETYKEGNRRWASVDAVAAYLNGMSEKARNDLEGRKALKEGLEMVGQAADTRVQSRGGCGSPAKLGDVMQVFWKAPGFRCAACVAPRTRQLRCPLNRPRGAREVGEIGRLIALTWGRFVTRANGRIESRHGASCRRSTVRRSSFPPKYFFSAWWKTLSSPAARAKSVIDK